MDYNISCSLGTWPVGDGTVMVKNKIEVIDQGSDPTGRLAFSKMVYNDVPICVVSTYAPAQITSRRNFFQELPFHILSCKWLILGRDFNCVPDIYRHRNQRDILTDCDTYPLLMKEVIHPLRLNRNI